MCINQFIARSEKFDGKHFEMLKVGPRNSYSSFDLRGLDRNAHKMQANKMIHLSVFFDNTLPIVYKHFIFRSRCFMLEGVPRIPLFNMIRIRLFIEELQSNNMVSVQKVHILLCGFGSCHWFNPFEMLWNQGS